MSERKITYKIIKAETLLVNYEVSLDKNLRRVLPGDTKKDWTLLENHQCSNCPYSAEEMPYCPVALTVSDVLEEVDNARSTDIVRCEVVTDERTHLAEVDYQKAVYSLLGLLMATSDCSRFDFLRPAARFHLPFSTLEETIVRVSSMFLLTQYFKNPASTIEQGIQQLTDNYEHLDIVNHALMGRVRSMLRKGDVHQNAMIVLNSFAQVMSMNQEKSMKLVSEYFLTDSN